MFEGRFFFELDSIVVEFGFYSGSANNSIRFFSGSTLIRNFHSIQVFKEYLTSQGSPPLQKELLRFENDRPFQRGSF